MITIKVQTIKAAAEKYFDDHLAVGEYVTEGEENSPADEKENRAKYYTDQPITFHGKTTELLGLKPGSPVTKDQFSALLDNLNPVTKERLTSRTNEHRRLYFDATCSAPKSVSVMAVTMRDERLIKAHKEATQLALKELEKYAQTRVRVNGQYTVRKTHNMLVASATHTTSRANDPQLHTHNLIFNVTWDEVEKKFKAMEAYEVYNNVEYFTETYRNILAEKVMELGYQIERAKHGWEIKGVSKDICENFSKRSVTIKAAEKALEHQLGRTITNQERAILTELTRKSKAKNLTLDLAIDTQRSELSKEQLRGLENLLTFTKLKAKEFEEFAPKLKQNALKITEPTKLEKEAIAFAVAHIFERQSVVKKNEILSLALKSKYGKLDQNRLEKALKATEGLVWNTEKDTVGTLAGLSQEFFVTSFIESRKNHVQELLGDEFLKLIKNDSESGKNQLAKLRDDQLTALRQILQNKDQVMILEGGAGSGKSHLLKVLVEKIKEKEMSVTATAPTSGATQNLTQDIGVNAQTIQKILHKPSAYESMLKNGYLIVDEAGLLSLRQMEALFMVADKYNTRVLLVGDIRQHHGVEAGDALRAIKNFTTIEVARLTEIERQRDLVYRDAVREIQNQNVQKAWDIFKKMGAIHSREDYLKSLGENVNIDKLDQKLDYEKLYKVYAEKRAANQSVIVVTPTRTEVDNLTQGIRETLSKTDLKEEKIEKEVYASTRFTSAEKMSVNHYIARDNTHFINFIDASGGFAKNSTWAVKEVNEQTLLLQDVKTGEEREFDPKNHLDRSFDVVERKSIEVKVGETLLIQKNERVEILPPPDQKDAKKVIEKFTNGELVRVKEIKDSAIILEDGRTLSDQVKNYDYGYVSTSYSAQGKTCDHVIVAMTNAGGKALSQEQFYVSTSRGRQGIDIFIEDKEFIKARIESMGNRQFNMQLMDKDQRERILALRDKSVESLKSKAEKAAEKFVRELSQKPSVIDRVQNVVQSWKTRAIDFRNRQFDALKSEIATRINSSRETISKEKFPLEKDYTPMHQRLFDRDMGPAMGRDRLI